MKGSIRLAGTGWLCLAVLGAIQARPQENQQTPVGPYTLRLTAVLTNKNSAPLEGKRVIAYPLNAKGEALLVQTEPPGFVIKTWNPVGTTDSTGRFVLEMPLVARIDGSATAEVVIGIGLPRGPGLSLRSLGPDAGITYTDPKREREGCLTNELATDELSLLRKGADIIKVAMGKQSREADLGSIVIE